MFHWIDENTPGAWGGLLPTFVNEPHAYFVSSELPPSFPTSHWAKQISVNGSTGPNVYGFIWAWNAWAPYQSKMRIQFGVTDVAVCPAGGCTSGSAAKVTQYMDRMFYVWKHYAMPNAVISYANGGPGSYSWAGSAVSPSGRSSTWTTIWTNYIKLGQAGPHYTVTCP